MDINKWKALTELVKEARVKDAETLAISVSANAAWKAANATLTERINVLNGFVADAINMETTV